MFDKIKVSGVHVVNGVLPSLHGGSLEITLTVPLISGQTICLGSTNARGYLL